jgi:hypothetical protein
VVLDEQSRFRHTYVIGQTGTGKSTLLQNMILHDVERGRGVGVLDPHGTLIEEVLRHMPAERAEDVVLVDPTDLERPVGFNLLRIHEEHPFSYQVARDLLIDDLFTYLSRTAYSQLPEAFGPMFENQFRGMLGLLLGVDPPAEPCIPNLMLFRSLYTNDDLRDRLKERIKGRDPVLEEAVKEAERTGGEASLRNIAGYVTSKFNRFISDIALRHMVCQRSMLDFDEIVGEGRILLFYLGKGRFGEQSAGLLANQVVSRLRGAVMKRGTGPDLRPFYLYADEFHLLADERFAELLAEGRKYGLALTMAHQFTSQIAEHHLRAILGNVGTMAALRVGVEDAEHLAPLFAPVFQAADLSGLPNFRACVRGPGALGNAPFTVDLDPPREGGDDGQARSVRERSRQKHGTPREEVERQIVETHRAFNNPPVDPDAELREAGLSPFARKILGDFEVERVRQIPGLERAELRDKMAQVLTMRERKALLNEIEKTIQAAGLSWEGKSESGEREENG